MFDCYFENLEKFVKMESEAGGEVAFYLESFGGEGALRPDYSIGMALLNRLEDLALKCNFKSIVTTASGDVDLFFSFNYYDNN